MFDFFQGINFVIMFDLKFLIRRYIIDLPGLHLHKQCQFGKKGNFRYNISDKTSILEDRKVRMGISQDGKHVIQSF